MTVAVISNTVDSTIPIVKLFQSSPLTGVALCVTLITVLWCGLLIPRLQWGRHRFLIAFLGFASIYNAVRLINDVGVEWLRSTFLANPFSTLMISLLYAAAVFILEIFCADHYRLKARLRIVEESLRSIEPLVIQSRSAAGRRKGAPLTWATGLPFGYEEIDGGCIGLAVVDAESQVPYANRVGQLILEDGEPQTKRIAKLCSDLAARKRDAEGFTARAQVRIGNERSRETIAVGLRLPAIPSSGDLAVLLLLPLAHATSNVQELFEKEAGGPSAGENPVDNGSRTTEPLNEEMAAQEATPARES